MGEIIFQVILLIFAIVMFISGFFISIEDQTLARIWPETILLVLIIFLGVSIVQSYMRQKHKTEYRIKEVTHDPQVIKVMCGIVFLVIYALIISTLGFIISTCFLGLAFTTLYDQKFSVKNILLSCLISVSCYLLFRKVFLIMLPKGVFIFRQVSLWIEQL